MAPKITIPRRAGKLSERQIEQVAAFAREGIAEKPARAAAQDSPYWQALRNVGTELWLDSGDMDEIGRLWCRQFSAVTTNNTLLNKEVQKGIYDDLVGKAGKLLADLDDKLRVAEIAFILNARHGLRLVERFGCKVSVELHTDLTHDWELSVFYGLRFHAIAPKDFIVKIPFSPDGLIATRLLREAGVPINHTLGFSARQNHLIAGASFPNWVNVFLGRLNAYVKDNGLGDGNNVGEKATLASQRAVRAVSHGGERATRQIAASMRAGDQVVELAGVDVFTMPTKVAQQAIEASSSDWRDRSGDDPDVTLSEAGAQARLETLWEVDEPVRELTRRLRDKPPKDPGEIHEAARATGAKDVFPDWSAEDRRHIAGDGKIPKHERWAARVRNGELAVDTLLNAAGYASFSEDQAALDARIREHLG